MLSQEEINQVTEIVNSLVQGQKLSEQLTTSSLNDSDLFYVVQNGESKKVNKATLATIIASTGVYWESLEQNSSNATLLSAYLAGLTQTSSNDWKIGDGTDGEKTLTWDIGSAGNNPKFRYNDSTNVIEYANDGVNYLGFGSVDLSSTLLTGVVFNNNSPIEATDSALVAFGKLQTQLNNISQDFILPAYNAATTYIGGNSYLVTTGSAASKLIWYFISGSNQVNVTPGDDDNVWLQVGSADSYWEDLQKNSGDTQTIAQAITAEIDALKAGVDSDGDTLNKLYNLIQGISPSSVFWDNLDKSSGDTQGIVAAITEQIDDLKDGVDTSGDTLSKLYNLIDGLTADDVDDAATTNKFVDQDILDKIANLNPTPEAWPSNDTIELSQNRHYQNEDVTSTLTVIFNATGALNDAWFVAKFTVSGSGTVTFNGSFASATDGSTAITVINTAGTYKVYGYYDAVEGRVLVTIPALSSGSTPQVATQTFLSLDSIDENNAANAVVAVITSDASPAATGYNLAGTDAAHFNVFDAGGGVFHLRAAASFDFEGPVDAGANNVYNFTLAAVNSEGTQTTPTDLNVSVNDVSEALSPPGPPTGLTATAGVEGVINLSWTAPASNGGAAITGYQIDVESPTGNGFSAVVTDTNNTNTTFEHSGLSNSTEYNYRVMAINSQGVGDPSNEDSATTIAGGVAFSPSDLTPYAWYKHDQGRTVSGSDVLTLSNQSGSAPSLSSVAGRRPTFDSNGILVTDDQGLSGGTVADFKFMHDGSAFTIMLVVEVTSVGNGTNNLFIGTNVGVGTGQIGWEFFWDDRSDTENLRYLAYTGIAGASNLGLNMSVTSSFSHEDTKILMARSEGDGANVGDNNDAFLEVNGTQIDAEDWNSPSSADSSTVFSIGGDTNANANQFYFKEVVIIDRALTPSEIADMEAYYNSEYTIT